METSRKLPSADSQLTQRLLLEFDSMWESVSKQTDYWSRFNKPVSIQSYVDFVQIPELSKQCLKRCTESFVNKNIKLKGLISTGGSTGAPLKMPIGAGYSQRVKRQQALGRAQYGVKYRDKCFLIWGHSAAATLGFRRIYARYTRWIKDRLIGYCRISAYELGCDKLQAALNSFLQFRPEWVYGYSSALVAFARANWACRGQIQRMNIKAVICSAETIQQDEVAELGRFFGAPVGIEYGAMEFGPIAYTRPRKKGFHIMDDLLVEAIRTDRENTYRLLVTSLYQRLVPLIRYDIGDEVKIYDSAFDGGIITYFDEIIGRRNDVIEFSDGSFAHSESVTHAIKDEVAVLVFQFHKWKNAMQLKLVVRPDADRSRVTSSISSKLRNINDRFSGVEIEYVEDVDVTQAGKRKWIIVHDQCKA